MKIKKVNRYYCDFCHKGGCGAGAMRKHEAHCTMNPNRACRICGDPVKAADFIHLVPRAEEYKHCESTFDRDREIVTEVCDMTNTESERIVQSLREACKSCPACMLAVIRQSKTILYFPFDYHKEAEAYFEDRREREAEEEIEQERHALYM